MLEKSSSHILLVRITEVVRATVNGMEFLKLKNRTTVITEVSLLGINLEGVDMKLVKDTPFSMLSVLHIYIFGILLSRQNNEILLFATIDELLC